MYARLTVLVDNEPGPRLPGEWGWSILIETGGWSVLFDADTDPGVLEHNSRVLGVGFDRVSYAVLSHFHHDHYGGFKYVGRVEPGLKIYVPPGRTSILREYGLNPVVVEKPVRLGDDAWLTGPLSSGFWGVKEQAFVFKADSKGLVVVVGCGHPGVDNLVRRAVEITGEKVYMVIGGFHSPPRRVLENVASMAERICPAHCSGYEAKEYVARRYPEKYCRVYSGVVITV